MPNKKSLMLKKEEPHVVIIGAGFGGPDIAVPIRKLLWKQENATVWMANVTRLRSPCRAAVR